MVPRKAWGYTFMEVAIVLAVLGILTGAALVTVQGYTQKAQLDQAVREVETLAAAAARYPWISGGVDYSGLSLTEIGPSRSGLIPGSLTGAAANPWGGRYYVGEVPGIPTRFRVGIQNVPARAQTSLGNVFRKRASAATGPGGWFYLDFY